MCGIWGAAKGRNMKNKKVSFTKFARAAALTGTLRGWDSTGIALVDESGETIVHKEALPGGLYVCGKEAGEMFELAAESLAFFGHNRAATVGNVDDDSAHPFQHGDVTVVHNGSVYGYLSDLRELLGDYDAVNDSDAIAYALSMYNWQDVLPLLDGAYALVWWDAETERLMLTRNEERPLHVAFGKYSNDMYFASEAKMLRWLGDRYNVVEDSQPIYELEAGVMYSFDLDKDLENGVEKESYEIKKPWPRWTGGRVWTPQGGGPATRTTPLGGTTITTTKNSSSQKALEKVGVRQGEVLGFLPEDISFNKERSRHGTVTGSLVKLRDDGTVLTTEQGLVYGITQETYSEWVRTGWLLVKAAGAFKDGSAIIANFLSYDEGGEDSAKEAEKSEKQTRTFTDGNGRAISEGEFMSIVSGGCCACGSPILPQDIDSIEFVGTNNNFVLCPFCAAWGETSAHC